MPLATEKDSNPLSLLTQVSKEAKKNNQETQLFEIPTQFVVDSNSSSLLGSPCFSIRQSFQYYDPSCFYESVFSVSSNQQYLVIFIEERTPTEFGKVQILAMQTRRVVFETQSPVRKSEKMIQVNFVDGRLIFASKSPSISYLLTEQESYSEQVWEFNFQQQQWLRIPLIMFERLHKVKENEYIAYHWLSPHQIEFVKYKVVKGMWKQQAAFIFKNPDVNGYFMPAIDFFSDGSFAVARGRKIQRWLFSRAGEFYFGSMLFNGRVKNITILADNKLVVVTTANDSKRDQVSLVNWRVRASYQIADAITTQFIEANTSQDLNLHAVTSDLLIGSIKNQFFPSHNGVYIFSMYEKLSIFYQVNIEKLLRVLDDGRMVCQLDKDVIAVLDLTPMATIRNAFIWEALSKEYLGFIDGIKRLIINYFVYNSSENTLTLFAPLNVSKDDARGMQMTNWTP